MASSASRKNNFNQIVRDIKSVKIQGATNIAKAALRAYFLVPNANSKRILLKSRPTEPMMARVLALVETKSKGEILNHFTEAQEKINLHVLKLLKDRKIVFTHCHSTNVSKALAYAHKKGKNFQVYVTETRPLYQGRKTARDMRKAKIPVTMIVDSGINAVLSGDYNLKKVNLVLLGADALLKEGIINKIGSELVARIAGEESIPFYIVADSWKFTKKKVPIEQRALNEVWDQAPKKIKIKNPAFEFVPKKYIKGIITEFGIMSYDRFFGFMGRTQLNL